MHVAWCNNCIQSKMTERRRRRWQLTTYRPVGYAAGKNWRIGWGLNLQLTTTDQASYEFMKTSLKRNWIFARARAWIFCSCATSRNNDNKDKRTKKREVTKRKRAWPWRASSGSGEMPHMRFPFFHSLSDYGGGGVKLEDWRLKCTGSP